MTTFNFDMQRIGQTIARLRREHNMTQMQLADLMAVSFQAVSNWERGQSMPDVSKLPELAEIFGTSIDELLGRSAPLVSHAACDTLDEFLQEAPVTVEEAAEAAPLLMPDQVERVTNRLLGLTELLPLTDPANDAEPEKQPEIPDNVHLPDLTALLPFMSTEKVDMILRRYITEDRSIASACLPFASSRLLNELAAAWEADGRDILPIVPFLASGEVDRIARSRMENGKPFVTLLPFMSGSAVDKLALSLEEGGQTIAPIVPFMGTATLERIFIARLQNGTPINELLPFISGDLLSRLADAASKSE